MNGYDTWGDVHVFGDDDDQEPDDELPSRVKYAVILQEEEDFMDEEV
jgi:hypothetical protein